MKKNRNVIFGAALVLFFAWYALSWAYVSLYKEPRRKWNTETAKLTQEIETGKKNLQLMTAFNTHNMPFYYRSLPRQPNDARSLYSFWLLELLQFCGLEEVNVSASNPVRTAFSYDYRFTVQCRGNWEQITRFLFEFYYALYLHRISAMTLTPQEKTADGLRLNLTIDALALYPRQFGDPYPPVNQLPTGWFVPRLASNNIADYGNIARRNFLQVAKGGVDKADYTYLTAISQTGNQKECWFTDRTDGTLVKVKKGGTVHVGSFNGTVAEIIGGDLVILQNGFGHWLLSAGDCLNQAFCIP